MENPLWGLSNLLKFKFFSYKLFPILNENFFNPTSISFKNSGFEILNDADENLLINYLKRENLMSGFSFLRRSNLRKLKDVKILFNKSSKQLSLNAISTVTY